ncbi:MAG: flagellar assembly protein FliW [Pseudomonadota bacterium]|nr:flagellar assembly protein FliW [Pseudomonadota bacterium]
MVSREGSLQYSTSRFGDIEISEGQEIWIKGGLFGFTNLSKYIIIHQHSQGPFVWLQSLERPELAFPLIDPHLAYPDYILEISREEADEIGIEDEDDVKIFVLAAMQAGNKLLQLNMQGPLIINQKKNLAMQFVDYHCQYSGEVGLESANEKQVNGG